MVELKYTAVIRTLGTAGEKYQALLDSLAAQTIKPEAILVYIAEGYPLPKETIGIEQYIYVKKGMVAQRALQYKEVQTDWMLFLDDDVYLAPTSVETLFGQLMERNADVISPDVFPNAKRSFVGLLMMAVPGRMLSRKDDGKWGYKVMRTAGYSYNAHPVLPTYWSQTNAGPCFLCKKQTFLDIHFEEELWMDKMPYAMGDDQVMFYKMYLLGKHQLTSYNSGIIHLDAGSAMQSLDKEKSRISADLRFKLLFWYRFIYRVDRDTSKCSILLALWDILCIGYAMSFTLLISLLKGQWGMLKLKKDAMTEAVHVINSEAFKSLPKVKRQWIKRI